MDDRLLVRPFDLDDIDDVTAASQDAENREVDCKDPVA
jgi:hypothetical protein